MFRIALFVSKFVDWSIHLFNLGSGSTWPGEVALRIDPLFVQHMIEKTLLQTILIVGTNGKTTTAALIAHGLHKKGKRTINNPEGANLLNGVASTLVKKSLPDGTINSDFGLFELDENAFSHVIAQIKKPHIILFLNLFRDQLDRYGEVHSITARWQKALSTVTNETTLIINGDDPRLAYMGKQTSLPTIYFGSSKEDKSQKEVPHDVDSVHCPACGSKLLYFTMSYSHLGDYACKQCGFAAPERWSESIESIPVLLGLYNRYNVRAAVMALRQICGIEHKEARNLLEGFHPAFGRQEHITAMEKEWIIILAKNPAGFNQSIDSLHEIVKDVKTDIGIILNDRIPDGTDISWIWDVEFEKVLDHTNTIVVSGDRTYDMAIRMETVLKDQSAMLKAEPELKNALNSLAKNHTSTTPIIILATYTGMLEVRKILKGRALL